jgi:hypothetical protein
MQALHHFKKKSRLSFCCTVFFRCCKLCKNSPSCHGQQIWSMIMCVGDSCYHIWPVVNPGHSRTFNAVTFDTLVGSFCLRSVLAQFSVNKIVFVLNILTSFLIGKKRSTLGVIHVCELARTKCTVYINTGPPFLLFAYTLYMYTNQGRHTSWHYCSERI